MKKKNGGFIEDAKNGLVPQYNINQFCVNEKTTKRYFTTPAVQFIMFNYIDADFKEMVKCLDAGLNLKQFEQNNNDDYYRVVSALENLELKKGKRGKVRSRLNILKKYEEELEKKKAKKKKK